MSEPATVLSHSPLTTVMCSVNQNRKKTRLTTVSLQQMSPYIPHLTSRLAVRSMRLDKLCCGIPPAVRTVVCKIKQNSFLSHDVTLQALSSTPTNPHSCFAWSYKALAMLVDCMWSFGWRLEGGGEDSHKVCNLFDK